MNFILIILNCILVIVLNGCAANTKIICSKPGMSEAEFKKDNYECVQQARTSWSGGGSGLVGAAMIASAQENANRSSRNLYKMCMEARGYTTEEISTEDYDKKKEELKKEQDVIKKEQREGRRGYLGIYWSSYGKPSIMKVEPNSPASGSGIMKGDIIIERDGVPVSTGDDLRKMPPVEIGQEVELKVLRNEEELLFVIKAGKKEK